MKRMYPAICAALVAGALPLPAAPVFTEAFPDGNTILPLTDVQWSARRNGASYDPANIIATSGPVIGHDGVSNRYLFHSSNITDKGPHLWWALNFPATAYRDLATIRFALGNANGAENIKVAIQSGDEWFVSALDFNHPGSAANFAARELDFTSATWNALDFDTLAVGPPGNPSIGAVANIGFFSSDILGHVRIDSVAVDPLPPPGDGGYAQHFNSGGTSFQAHGWSFLASQDVGGVAIRDLSAATLAIGVTSAGGGYGFFAPQNDPGGGALVNAPALMFTTAATPASVADLVSVSFDWIGDNLDATVRVAVLVDGVWYASAVAYQDPRPNPGPAASFITNTFAPESPALASRWRRIENTEPGGPGVMSLGTAPASDLAAPLQAVGLLLDAGASPQPAGDHVRIGRFETSYRSSGPPPGPPPPNVLFITIDDLSDTPRFMGRNPDALTPHIDSLASSGTAFSNAHCSYPLCGPSRASFMSGLKPTTLGFQGHMSNNDLLLRTEALGGTLLHTFFKQRGYKTMSAGKIYHAGQPPGSIDLTGGNASFGQALGLNYSAPGTLTDWGVPANYTSDAILSDYQNAEWAVARLGETHPQPFLLMVGFVQPHVPWYAPQPWFDLYPDKNALALEPFLANDFDDIPAEAETLSLPPQYPRTTWAIANNQRENIQQAYLACASFTDHYLGQVLTALENSPYADNTIVVVLSDHGYHLGSKNTYQKETLWDRSSRVPLIFAGPGVPAGQVSKRPVSLLDVYPTLLDLCGLPDNPMLEGESLRPLLENPAAEWRRPALISLLGNNHAVQGERFRLLRWNDGSEELYDHQTDPHEHHNLAADPAHAAIKAELESALPTNLKSSGFRTRFSPNRGTPQEYLDELMARGALWIHDQPVAGIHSTVEGMGLATSVAGGFINLELVPASPFGNWRQSWFSSRELRDLAVSGSTGNASADPFPNLAKYALGLDPKQVNPALMPGFESHNGGLTAKLAFERSAARTDIDIHLELSTTLAADDWLVIARSAAGGQTEALHGATVIESGTEPRAVEVLAPQPVDDLPAAFLRFRIDPVD